MRYYYLDSMRSILMILGVFSHAAMIFAVGIHWRVGDSERSRFFTVFTDLMYAFRMPMFFIIAGFFSLLCLGRDGARKFLLSRSRRILIPFVCTILFVNSIQFFLTEALMKDGFRDPAGFLRNLLTWHLSGKTISHLWFLNHLFLFIVLLVIFRMLARRIRFPAPLRERTGLLFEQICVSGIFLALLPLNEVMAYAIQYRAASFCELTLPGGIEVRRILVNLPYFVFGALLFHNGFLYGSLFKIRGSHLLLSAVALLVFFLLEPAREQKLLRLLRVYSGGLLLWMSFILCFCAFRRVMNYPSRLMAWLADASYTVYLFHQLFVIAFGLLLVPLNISIYVKYALIVAATLACTLSIHHFLVLRFRLPRLLFNGKFLKGPAEMKSIHRAPPSSKTDLAAEGVNA